MMHIVVSCCDLILLLFYASSVAMMKKKKKGYVVDTRKRGIRDQLLLLRREESKNQVIIECEIINRGKHQWIPPIVFSFLESGRCSFLLMKFVNKIKSALSTKLNLFLSFCPSVCVFMETIMLCSHHIFFFFLKLRRNKTLSS